MFYKGNHHPQSAQFYIIWNKNKLPLDDKNKKEIKHFPLTAGPFTSSLFIQRFYLMAALTGTTPQKEKPRRTYRDITGAS